MRDVAGSRSRDTRPAGPVTFLARMSSASPFSSVCLWPPADRGDVRKGDELFALRPRCVAYAEADPLPADAPKYAGRVLVRFVTGGTAHVQVHKVVRRAPRAEPGAPPTLVVVGETPEYRQACRQLPSGDDFAVDIGSSFGHSTDALRQQSARALGIEVSKEVLADAQRRFPECRFERVDVIGDRERTKALVDGAGACFVDIGGNRMVNSLIEFLAWLADVVRPRIIVVKSRYMFQAVLAHVGDRGVGRDMHVPDHAAFWAAFAKANADPRLPRHALEFPESMLDGVHICRFHNYDEHGCKRLAFGNCPLNHTHCHRCKAEGHIARDCPHPFGYLEA